MPKLFLVGLLHICHVVALPMLSQNRSGNDVTVSPEVGSKNVTAIVCPYMCMIADHTFCNPPPCPPPPCVDYRKYQPFGCCDWCPNGPNCMAPKGQPIPENQSKIIDGKNCTCLYPPSDATCV